MEWEGWRGLGESTRSRVSVFRGYSSILELISIGLKNYGLKEISNRLHYFYRSSSISLTASNHDRALSTSNQ